MTTLRVYKYHMPVIDRPVVMMPLGAKILHISEQVIPGDVFLWALVDISKTEIEHKFRLLGTGDDPGHWNFGEHIYTFFVSGGRLVFHLFWLR